MPRPKPIEAHEQRLQQDHRHQRPVAGAHRFECAVLLDVLDREQVKRLGGDRRADDETRAPP